MYRQEGNKGPHKDVDEAGCLAALSYLALQELNIITNTSASTTISMQHGIAHYHHVKSSRVLLALTELPAARSFPLPADEEVPILPAVRRRYRSLGAAEKTLVGLASGTVEAINKRKAVEDDDFEKALGEVKTGGFTGKGVKKWQPSLSKF